MVKILFESDDTFTINILEYLTKYTDKYQFMHIEDNDNNTDFDEDDTDGTVDSNIIINNKKIKYCIDYNDFSFDYEGNVINISYYEFGDPVGLQYEVCRMERLVLTCTHNNDKDKDLEILNNFLLSIDKKDKKPLKNKIRCFITGEHDWEYLSKIPKRNINTVFIEEKKDLLDDIEKFMNSEEDYTTSGVPYKRNYLLHGLPGTGKTSLISAIGSKYDLDLYLMNFACNITDSKFMKLVSQLPKRSLLVLEDIDNLFVERVDNDSKTKSSVSFSAILNVLDGVARKNKLITFMTTNNIDKIDTTLRRPGRIDYIIEFDYAKNNQIEEMFLSFFPNKTEIMGIFLKEVKSIKTSMAVVQKYLFENRYEKDIMSNIKKLHTLSEQYNKTMHMYL